MGKKSSKAPAPDPQIGAAALAEAELGKEWLALSREQFAISEKRQAETDAMAREVSASQLAAQKQASEWASEDRDRYKSTFQPIEDKYAADAMSWDSPERQAAMAAEAKADVINNATQQKAAGQRSMAAMGVSPTSGRFAGVDRTSEVQTALAAAGAQNTARNNVRMQGVAMRADAINMGKGLPSQAATAAGLGISAGSAALGTNMAANSQWTTNNQIMAQGYQGAMSGYQAQGNILNNSYSNQISAWSSGQNAAAANSAGTASAVGAVAGVGLMMF
ncbi:tail fiber domain-containing protein [Agrobacterium tumefaciens]|uniref:tail fiber domain-containing protein n=1 Tax=Agrobacterium tumefaciens TaxID=358 RepID=UPI0015740D83|nr:tail fiber domain-containing protein [Agrobacterium tumefaciens]